MKKFIISKIVCIICLGVYAYAAGEPQQQSLSKASSVKKQIKHGLQSLHEKAKRGLNKLRPAKKVTPTITITLKESESSASEIVIPLLNQGKIGKRQVVSTPKLPNFNGSSLKPAPASVVKSRPLSDQEDKNAYRDLLRQKSKEILEQVSPGITKVASTSKLLLKSNDASSSNLKGILKQPTAPKSGNRVTFDPKLKEKPVPVSKPKRVRIETEL